MAFERVTMKVAPITARTADVAPAVPACCQVCRTCTTTNLVGLGLAAVTGAAYGIARLGGRRMSPDPPRS